MHTCYVFNSFFVCDAQQRVSFSNVMLHFHRITD
nr:MAG TPA: hypothetical protein [Bacteriophage sp.]